MLGYGSFEVVALLGQEIAALVDYLLDGRLLARLFFGSWRVEAALDFLREEGLAFLLAVVLEGLDGLPWI
jgi:hypothetical protein